MSLKIAQILNNLIDVNDLPHDRKYSRVAKLHKYWSRKPWFVIDQYINKYSKRGDLILDPFCGSGIIGLQSVLANRKFIGYDLNPFAVFLSNNSVDIEYDKSKFEKQFHLIEETVRENIMPLYKTKDKFILYTILGEKNSKNYNAIIADKDFKNKEKVNLNKKELAPQIRFPKSLKYPDKEFPVKFYKDRFSYKGVRKVSDMFSRRNLLSLALLYNAIQKLPLEDRSLFMLAFTNTLLHVSKLKGENVRPLGVNNFWIPDDFIEENVWWRFVDRVNNLKMAKEVIAEKALQNKIVSPISKVYNKSSLNMLEIKAASVDYLITDPPYGDTIQYSELSYIWNCWLEEDFMIEKEVIINPVQNKGVAEYYKQLVSFISETKRVLKKDANFTLAFQNKDINIWIRLAELIRDQGMQLVDISSYDTFGSPYNKNWAKFSPKSDFYVTFKNVQKKPAYRIQRKISPHDVASEIISCLGNKNEGILNLHKAYDLFIGVVINKIFEGYQMVEFEKLNIEKVIALFKEVPPYKETIKKSTAKLFDLEPVLKSYGNI